MVGKAIAGEDAAAEQHQLVLPTSNRTWENGLKEFQGMFRLDIRESFFPGRVAKH